MLPAIIDHPTLTKWKNRAGGEVHGEIMANIDNLILTALRYDDAVVLTRDQLRKIQKLEAEAETLRLECEELKLAACRTWQCAGRR